MSQEMSKEVSERKPFRMGDFAGMRVFLSGPMSGVENYNAAAFAGAHAAIKLAGAECVYDPALEWLMGDDVPDEAAHEAWMRTTVHELTRPIAFGEADAYYDVCVLLDGWRESEGAQLEKVVADAAGIWCVAWEEVSHGEE